MESITADFADLNSVKGMADELNARFPAIHTLVCNAGVLLPVIFCPLSSVRLRIINKLQGIQPWRLSVIFCTTLAEGLSSLVLRSLQVKQTSKDGYEMTLAVNHLAHFLLTNLIMEKVQASGTPDQKARIIAVSSICHR